MQIDFNDEQNPKTDSPRVDSLLTASNATSERFVHFQKQCPEMTSTDEGIEINCSDLHVEKADSPRIDTRQAG
jgi:hypothetical protein